MKNQYRKFNIKSADLTPGDDYAMMREVLTRRFKRLVLDEAEAPAGVRPSGSDTCGVSTPDSGSTSVEHGVGPGGSDTLPHRAAAAAADRPARRQRAGLRRAAGGRRTPTARRGRRRDRGRRRSTPMPTGAGRTPASDEFPDAARPGADRRRSRPARRRAARCWRRSAFAGVAADRRRQGARPRCRPRAFPHSRPRPADDAGAARSRALFRAAAARRGAPLRHRHAPRQARQGDRRQPARRDRRHRPGAQARAAQAFRLGQGRVARRRRGSAGGRGHQRARWRRRSTISSTSGRSSRLPAGNADTGGSEQERDARATPPRRAASRRARLGRAGMCSRRPAPSLLAEPLHEADRSPA